MTARDLRDRVVLLTGATAGVGRATTERLAAAGATVVGCARDEAALAGLAVAVPGFVPRRCDVRDAEQRARLVGDTLAEQGRIDALVSNVGIGWTGAFTDMTAEQVVTLVDTNVTATIDLARLAVPGMVARGDGDVLLIASGASWFAVPPLTVYSATKYAVAGFAEGLRREVAAKGVRVHTVHPGLVATQFAARSAGDRPGDLQDGDLDESAVDVRAADTRAADRDGVRRAGVKLGPGFPPEWVAAAVERSLTRPGRDAVAVPRILGATRVVKLPVIQPIVDHVVAAGSDRLVALGKRVAAQAAWPAPGASHDQEGVSDGRR